MTADRLLRCDELFHFSDGRDFDREELRRFVETHNPTIEPIAWDAGGFDPIRYDVWPPELQEDRAVYVLRPCDGKTCGLIVVASIRAMHGH